MVCVDSEPKIQVNFTEKPVNFGTNNTQSVTSRLYRGVKYGFQLKLQNLATKK